MLPSPLYEQVVSSIGSRVEVVDCEARETDGGLEITLTQTRYFSDADVKPTGQLWPVPLVFRYGTSDSTKEKRLLLTSQRATLRLEGARWFYPNAGGRGFYRFKLSGIADLVGPFVGPNGSVSARPPERSTTAPAASLMRRLRGRRSSRGAAPP